MLKWTAQQAAARAGINRRTIERLEADDGPPGARIQTLDSVVRAYESAGVEFVGTPDDAPGIRFRREAQS